MIELSFIEKHCPCYRKRPCPDRSAGCHASCPEWAEWERAKAEESRRVYENKRASSYTASKCVESAERSARYHAGKTYPVGKSRYPRPSKRKAGGEK